MPEGVDRCPLNEAVRLSGPAEFYNPHHGRAHPRTQPHHRAAGRARTVRVRAARTARAAEGTDAPACRASRRRPRCCQRATAPSSTWRPTCRSRPRCSTRPRNGWPAKAASAPASSPATPTSPRTAPPRATRSASPSGLDSMVLGEPQILGQMKQAVREADEAGTLGTTLHQLFQRSFAVAKEVRTSTEIGAHSVSMAAAAVRLAGQLFEDLRQQRVLFVGAGEMIELVATHFAAREPKSITLANRTLERGEALASALRRTGAPPGRPARAPARVRHRRLLHRQLAADHRPGRGGARVEGAAAPADVHGRPGRAARHRARSGASWPTSTSTPSTTCRRSCRPPARSARPRSSRPRRSSTPASRASRTGSTSAPACR